MSEDTKQPETEEAPQAKLRLYYRRLLIISFITLIVSGIWCLMPFWKEIFSGNLQFPGLYWLFVAESGFAPFSVLLLLLGGIGLFCFSHFFRTPHPEVPQQKLMSLNELRDLIGLLGVAIGFAIVVRLGIRMLLLDLVVMENVSSVVTENHVYHLSHYTLLGFSDGDPYGLIECDAFDITCKQIKQIIMRWGTNDPEQPTLEYDDRSGRLFISARDIDHPGKHPTLRYDDTTHMLYMEGNGQVYYAYKLDE